ncbi:MAG: CDP-glycerol glycerophosphotransferase family protein [Prevotella sp.]|nr:CDP-glycerol glycerophosphotransferase family protein [Prevotella sp.]
MTQKRRISRLTLLRQKIEEAWLYRIGYRLAPLRQQRYIRHLQGRSEIRVVFVVVSIPMWKYQGLYDLLRADARFRVQIVLSPSMNYSDEQRLSDIRVMRSYFDSRAMPYVDWDIEHDAPAVDIRRELNPDIVCYSQPYHGVFHPRHQFLNFTDRLLAYYPYGALQTSEPFLFDQVMTNIAWRLYYSDRYVLADACRFMRNGGSNVVVVGYPNADLYTRPLTADPWHDEGHRLKRVIWAPHCTLANDGSSLSKSNFLDLSEAMLRLAHDYRDRVQIAFKPHPGLLTELYRHPDWGKQRTDDYYKRWSQMENTQLETGDYIELFKGSDAMIHDCGSFVIDYLYFRRPVMFLTRDIQRTRQYGNELCRQAYDIHYTGCTEQDIRRFIDDVVLGGNDPLSASRHQFYQDNLLPPGGQSVARNTYDDLVESLGIPKLPDVVTEK